MDKCRLVIIHWSLIITISIITFWIHDVSSASVNTNIDIPDNLATTDKIIRSSSSSSSSSSLSSSSSSSSSFTATAAVSAAALLGITTESFCSHQTERFIQSEGKQSSLIFELKPNLLSYGTCKRILTAPESHGFFIRLVRSPKIKKLQNQSNSGLKRNHHGINQKLTNSTYSCPLSIFSGTDPLTPWKIDPCQIELNNDIDEPVRLLSGHLRIIWEHYGNNPSSYLMITVLGKGETCQKNDKHPCLKFGEETLLCIAKDLICDGIHHCPKGSEYDSDEDYDMCMKRKKNLYGDYDSEAWEHLTIEIFRNLFNTEKTLIPIQTSTLQTIKNKGTKGTLLIDNNKTTIKSTMMKIDDNDVNQNNLNDIDQQKSNNNNNNNHNNQSRRNITRSSIAGDLSKYGPWGYLMLGMLLCGGALLICGLWECCCRQNKSGDTTIVGSTLPGANNTNPDVISTNDTQQDISPPNYDDLDPPPPYSVLFPNQKLSNCSSSRIQTGTTISSTTTTTTTAAAATATAATTITTSAIITSINHESLNTIVNNSNNRIINNNTNNNELESR